MKKLRNIKRRGLYHEISVHGRLVGLRRTPVSAAAECEQKPDAQHSHEI